MAALLPEILDFTEARKSIGDDALYVAIGVGYGLERLAMLRYRIDDIRRIDVSSVA